MRRLWWLVVALALSPVTAAARPFITVRGTQLMEGERPFHFVGANLNVMHGPTARAAAGRTIAAAARDGLRVGRIWALGEGLSSAPEWSRRDYLFRAGPTGWQEAAFRQLDRVIELAREHGLRLVITLSNHWKDYGGIPLYLRWAGHVDVESYGYSDRFFTDPRCREWYWAHVARIVTRVNQRTGVPYREDPTIMAWELQNELHGTPEAAADRRRWVTELSRRIRALDPNHLVVPGTLGYNLELERRDWIAMCRLPAVSYCDQHTYATEHLRTRGALNLRRHIDDRVQLAHHVVGKPMVFGEYGFPDAGSMVARARLHRRYLERVFHDGASGALVWIYQPSLSWKRTYGVLIDRRRHLPVRRALAAVARRIRRRPVRNENPMLGPGRGARPIAPTHAMLTRRRRPHGGWARPRRGRGPMELTIAVDQFARAWFEEGGSWAGGVLVHAYGRRTGWIEYRFRGPRFVPARLEIEVRLSSEYPGSVAPPDGRSRVHVQLDGRPLRELIAEPDDGVGSWHRIALADRATLNALRGGVHVLRFEVTRGELANGVAIYGREARLNREPVERPGPLRLVAYPAFRRPASP